MGLNTAITVNGRLEDELTSASSIEVYDALGSPVAYTLRYEVDISEGDLPLLSDERLDPGSEITIAVPDEEGMQSLVKGPVHGQKIELKHGGGGSLLTVRGSDTSIIMDREAKSAVWDGVSDSDVVSTILGRYGYSAAVESIAALHEENGHTLVQRESDMSFIRKLARRNGCFFRVRADAAGIETAYFNRPDLDGEVGAELIINLDNPTISSLSITWDSERPTSVEGIQLDLRLKGDLTFTIPRTPQTVLGSRALADITGDTRSLYFSAPGDSGGALQARAEAVLVENDWFVTATCSTTLERLGTILRAGSLVEVRGAGSRHSGRYLIGMVHHFIDAAVHRMELELLRNGWNG